jgi:hypothetical protein
MRPLDCALKVRSLTIPLSRRLSMFAAKWSMGATRHPDWVLGAMEQKRSIRKMSSEIWTNSHGALHPYSRTGVVSRRTSSPLSDGGLKQCSRAHQRHQLCKASTLMPKHAALCRKIALCGLLIRSEGVTADARAKPI